MKLRIYAILMETGFIILVRLSMMPPCSWKDYLILISMFVNRNRKDFNLIWSQEKKTGGKVSGI